MPGLTLVCILVFTFLPDIVTAASKRCANRKCGDECDKSFGHTKQKRYCQKDLTCTTDKDPVCKYFHCRTIQKTNTYINVYKDIIHYAFNPSI